MCRYDNVASDMFGICWFLMCYTKVWGVVSRLLSATHPRWGRFQTCQYSDPIDLESCLYMKDRRREDS